MNRNKLMNKISHVLGESFVRNSGLAIPELLKAAAVEIFFNCDDDGDCGDSSYHIRLALLELRRTGEIKFD